MAAKSRIETELAEADLAEFRSLLATGRLTIDALTLWLDGRGYEISRSAVGRYVQGFEEVAGQLRQSRQMTEALVSELGEAATQGKHGRLLVEMARNLAFDFLMKARREGVPLETKNIQELGKGLAELGRALRLDQDFEVKIREQVRKEEAERAVAAAEKALGGEGEGGAPPDRKEVLRRIREEVYGIVG